MKSFSKSLWMTVALLAGAALVLTGCGEGEQSPQPQTGDAGPSAQQPTKEQTGDQAPEGKQQEQQKKEEEKTADAGEKKQEGEEKEESDTKQKETDDGEEAEQANMVKLDPGLPKPMFAGTPSDLSSPILEPNPEKGRGDIKVPEGATENLAEGKPVNAKGTPIMGELSMVTDGDKSGRSGTVLTLGPGKQWVQIDLEKKYKIYGILVWHYHSKARIYHDVIAQVANNKDFVSDVQTVFNNDQDNSSGLGVGEDYEYIEDNEGKWIKVDGVTGRYLRLYSNGSTANSLNHYVEVAVYGIPAE